MRVSNVRKSKRQIFKTSRLLDVKDVRTRSYGQNRALDI